MCGIAGIYLRKPEAIKNHAEFERFINCLFKGIEHRGKHATGFCAMTPDNKVIIDKAATPASDFIKTREAVPVHPRAVLLHTRWATKGDVKDHGNNHPVINGSCFVTHNGSIMNDDDLFEKYNLKRTAEVDSEAIAALLHHFGMDDVKKTAEILRGPAAFAAIDPINSPGKLLLVRGNSSPLVVLDAGKFVVWASTMSAIKDAWGAVIGTPPAAAKFRDVKEGTAIMLDGERTHEEKFTPDRGNYSKHSSQGAWQGTGWERTPTGGYAKGGTSGVVTGSLRDVPFWVKATVERVRREGHGKGRLYIEHQRIPYDSLKEKSTITWQTCISCHQQLPSDDMKYVAYYGRMCVDCSEAVTETEPAKDAPKRYVFTENGVPWSVRNIIDKWSTKEKAIHQQAVRNVALRSGATEDTVDFLLHRAMEHEMEQIDGLKEAAATLFELYCDEIFAIEDATGEDSDDWVKHAKAAQETEQARKEATAKAATAPTTNTDPPSTIEQKSEVIPLRPDEYSYCKACGMPTWPSKANMCVACDFLPVDEDEPPAEVVIDLAEQPEKCASCRRKAVVWHSSALKSVGWCGKHYEECHSRGCHSPANSTHDNTRLCHAHARGKKGLMTDSAIGDNGTVIEDEVRA